MQQQRLVRLQVEEVGVLTNLMWILWLTANDVRDLFTQRLFHRRKMPWIQMMMTVARKGILGNKECALFVNAKPIIFVLGVGSGYVTSHHKIVL